MMYHVLESLRYLNSGERILAGTVSSLKGLSPKAIELLLAKGRIAKVQAPPLAILPGFEERAVEYAERGIEDIHDLTEAEDVPAEDIQEAKRWFTEYDSPGATPMMAPVAPDVFELDKVDDDELVE